MFVSAEHHRPDGWARGKATRWSVWGGPIERIALIQAMPVGRRQIQYLLPFQ